MLPIYPAREKKSKGRFSLFFKQEPNTPAEHTSIGPNKPSLSSIYRAKSYKKARNKTIKALNTADAKSGKLPKLETLKFLYQQNKFLTMEKIHLLAQDDLLDQQKPKFQSLKLTLSNILDQKGSQAWDGLTDDTKNKFTEHLKTELKDHKIPGIVEFCCGGGEQVHEYFTILKNLKDNIKEHKVGKRHQALSYLLREFKIYEATQQIFMSLARCFSESNSKEKFKSEIDQLLTNEKRVISMLMLLLVYCPGYEWLKNLTYPQATTWLKAEESAERNCCGPLSGLPSADSAYDDMYKIISQLKQFPEYQTTKSNQNIPTETISPGNSTLSSITTMRLQLN